MSVRLTAEAERDIDEILRFGIVEFGEAQAETYYRGLTERFALLERWPEAAPVKAGARLPLRLFPYGSHVILYMRDGDDILILRVLHGRSDWMELL